jgi:hypothetical protein
MFSAMNLLIGVITGAFGVGYFIYGKKQSKLVFMISGIGLMIYPYLFSNIVVLIIIGLVLLAAPFLVKE